MTVDFGAVTEQAGSPATRPQLQRIVQRYQFACERVAGRRVLEVACGAGLGLGWLQRAAASVVGGDFTGSLVAAAKRTYGPRVPLVRLDAERLPVTDSAFDAIVIFEAIYYLSDLRAFLAEARRALAPGGLLLVSSVNPEWAGHSPSSFSTRYPTLAELASTTTGAGFDVVETLGGFPTADTGFRVRLIEAVRAVAARYRLIPNTLATRAAIKRLVYGGVTAMPAEISETTAVAPRLTPIASDTVKRRYQIVYLVARVTTEVSAAIP